MCDGHRGSLAGYWRNLRKPMPMGKKLRLVRRNLWVRISTLSDCCGHPGEPGC